MISALVIGQSPRLQLLYEMGRVLPRRVTVDLRGLLDRMTPSEIASHAPGSGDETLYALLASGTGVRLSHTWVAAEVRRQFRAHECVDKPIRLLCCTGEFPELDDAGIILPARILTRTVAAVAGRRRLGVFVPLQEQLDMARGRWQAAGSNDVRAVALDPAAQESAVDKAASVMKRLDPDLVVYDCISYRHETRLHAAPRLQRPAVLAVSLVARVIAELLDGLQSTGTR